jgi:hypothetical protein
LGLSLALQYVQAGTSEAQFRQNVVYLPELRSACSGLRSDTRKQTMDLNRNHYFIFGVVLFLLGLQFRYVSSFELNEKTSRMVDKRLGSNTVAHSQPFALFGAVHSSNRVVKPPSWLGWSFMSIGGVLFIYSLSMKKPGS